MGTWLVALSILRVQALGLNFYRENNGQTMHFFSEEYCRDILADWAMMDLTHLRLRDEAGTIIKCVWRCVAQKKASSALSDQYERNI